MDPKKERLVAAGFAAVLLTVLVAVAVLLSGGPEEVEAEPVADTTTTSKVRRVTTTSTTTTSSTVPGAPTTTTTKAPSAPGGAPSPGQAPPTTSLYKTIYFAELDGNGIAGNTRLEQIGKTNRFKFYALAFNAPDHSVRLTLVDKAGKATTTEMCRALPSGQPCTGEATLSTNTDLTKMRVDVFLATKTDGPAATGLLK